MLVALDRDGNRIYANSKVRYTECFCPECGGALTHKKGEIKSPHFAHKVDVNCPYGLDKDSKSEWHIHMQEIFPPESLEIRFKDDCTGEIHIADVYLERSKTVIEFQHSPISAEEFRSRTFFHVNNGRRIVWIFDERGKDSDAEFGRLRREYDSTYQPCHGDLHFRWLRSPRKMLNSITSNANVLQDLNYSVCIYYGEEDIVHRVIEQDSDYSEVVLSVHPIELREDMDTEVFFLPESHWLSFSPWKELVEKRNRFLAESERLSKQLERQRINSFLDSSFRRRGPRF